MSIAGWTTRLLLVLVGTTATANASVDYARDVRPILERRCYECHSSKKQQSGYRLDVRSIALRGGDSGEAAIVPHDAAASPLVRYVSGDAEGMQMPPEDSDIPRLTAEEIATLRAWIDAGPAWPDELAGETKDKLTWWSLRPLVRPDVPAISVGNAPVAHPVDAFILAGLRKTGLTPSPPAEPRVLVRRLYYDLTGLPPTADEVEAFCQECHQVGPDVAYGRLVAELLDSPRYGEHWARHWLDLAAYADTHGNDHDFARPNAWPFRDYVIRALNEDKPYRRFVEEQLAGDVLYPDDPQATVALGFLAAGPWDETLMTSSAEDTFDRQLTRVLDRDTMVSTVLGVFQSLTVHCARCHNHKFDPITQREYYALQSVFAGVDRADRPFDVDSAIHLRRRKLESRKQAIQRRAPSLVASLESPEVATQLAALDKREQQRPAAWFALEGMTVASLNSPDQTAFTQLVDGSWLASGARSEKDTFVITARVQAADIPHCASKR